VPAVAEEIAVTDRSRELLKSAGTATPSVVSEVRYEVVTAEDIEQGRRGDGIACALARALQRAFPGTEFDISGEHPTVNGNPLVLHPDIAEWIGRYDRGEPVQPFVIEVNLH
jgi:hypothetical protein